MLQQKFNLQLSNSLVDEIMRYLDDNSNGLIGFGELRLALALDLAIRSNPKGKKGKPHMQVQKAASTITPEFAVEMVTGPAGPAQKCLRRIGEGAFKMCI